MNWKERRDYLHSLDQPKESDFMGAALILPIRAEVLAREMELVLKRPGDVENGDGFAASMALAVRIARAMRMELPDLLAAVETRWKSKRADSLMIR